MALWPSNRNAQQASNQALNAYADQGLQTAYNRYLQQAMMTSLYGVKPAHKPSDKYPNTLGWRSWVWDMTANELRSPVHATTWDGIELRCERWDEGDVVRGVAGIHAYLVPDDWHTLVMDEAKNGGKAFAEIREGSFRACIAVQGIVERFGKYVLGEDGWRAEWVIIRKLAAPTEEIGLALEKAFPEVEIVYGNR